MFLAPALYLVHALLTGISCFIVALLPARAGFQFSAGLIDWVLSLKAPMAQNPWLLIPIGLVFFVVYYAIFRIMITAFKLKTPGREDDEDNEEELRATLSNNDFTAVAAKVLEGLGGKVNIASVDNCVTRLRIEVKDYTAVDEKMIKAAGVAGVIRPSKTSVQVVVGTQVQFVADELKKML
jgi:PTS system N-acetylglucosamine-specific IIC component